MERKQRLMSDTIVRKPYPSADAVMMYYLDGFLSRLQTSVSIHEIRRIVESLESLVYRAASMTIDASGQYNA